MMVICYLLYKEIIFGIREVLHHHHCHDQLWDFVIVIFPPSSSRAKNTMVGTSHGGNVLPSNDENDDDDDDDNDEDDGDEFDYDGYDDDDDHLFWPPR